MVAAPHYLATNVGTNILSDGGNAFDAAVGVALTIGVAQPYHSGLGGGCNITYLQASGEHGHINARGPAPAGLSRDMFFDDGTPNYTRLQTGGLASTIPSFVAGLWALHKRRGNLPWADICARPAAIAAEGFTADFMMAKVYSQASTAAKVAKYAQTTEFAAPIAEGQYVVQPQLAETLTAIGKDARSIYTGDVAKALVDTINSHGGVLSLQDLADYQPQHTDLHETHYRGWRVLAPGLPTIGSLQTQLALKILQHFPLDTLTCGSAQHMHLLAEVVKATYHMRASIDDEQAAAAIADDAQAERLAAGISLDKVQALRLGHDGDGSCTSHFCVADVDGNVVSQTQTVRSYFGSGVVCPTTGIVLNDSAGDFSLQAGQITTQGISYQGDYNLLAAGSEPASSQSPLIALHPDTGDVIAAGAAGGPRIVSATLQALTNQIDFEHSPQQAVAARRVHSHGAGINVEASAHMAQALSSLGHTIKATPSMGITQSIRRDGETWQGGADPRGPGGAAVVLQTGDTMTVRRYGTSYGDA